VVLFLLLLVSLAINVLLLAGIASMRALLSALNGMPKVRSVVIHHGSKDMIAVIPVAGLINGATVNEVLSDIHAVNQNSHIRAVVLRVDSPGGAVTDADEIYHDLMKLRARGCPIVVSMGAMAASGGYYVSMVGERIFAEPTTMTGSIGVMLPGFQVTGLLKKIGVKPEFLTSSAALWKEAGSPFSDFTPPVRAYLRNLLNTDDARFEHIVQLGRGKALKAPMTVVANGKIFTAAEAVKYGLVDKIGYLGAACHQAAKLAGTYNPTVVRLAPPLNVLSAIGVKSAVGRPVVEISPSTIYSLACPKFEYLAAP
jgi:protease-4